MFLSIIIICDRTRFNQVGAVHGSIFFGILRPSLERCILDRASELGKHVCLYSRAAMRCLPDFLMFCSVW